VAERLEIEPGQLTTSGYPMGASFLFLCQLLLVGLVGALGYVGISSAVALLGLFLFIFVMVLLIVGCTAPETWLGPHRHG